MALALTYAQVEELLAELHAIDAPRRIAFQSRLRNFQRLGFPAGANTGRGKPVRYSFGQLMQLAAALELTQSGMAPQRVVRLLNANWNDLLVTVYLSTWHLKSDVADSEAWFWLHQPQALRELVADDETKSDATEAIISITSAELEQYLRSGIYSHQRYAGWRTLVINGEMLTRAVLNRLSDVSNTAIDEVRDELEGDLASIDGRSADLRPALERLLEFPSERRTHWERRIRDSFAQFDAAYQASLQVKAGNLARRLSPELKRIIAAEEGEELEITEQQLQELHDLGLITPQEDEAEFTDLARVITDVIEESRLDMKR